jgi:hypothetical protein
MTEGGHSQKDGGPHMNIAEEMLILGMMHIGRFAPVENGRSCDTQLTTDIPGSAVIVFTVGDAIKMFIATEKGTDERVRGAGSALKSRLDPSRQANDRFQAEGPEVIRAGLTIEIWARPSTRPFDERQALNGRYSPDWSK